MELYLISLEGMGDKSLVLIDKEMWDWVMTGNYPDERRFKDLFVERARLNWEKYFPNGFTQEKLEEAKTSADMEWENRFSENEETRAMGAIGVILEGKLMEFTSMKEMTEEIKKFNITIVEEYQGYLY